MSDPVREYAKAVVAGKVVAGQLVKLACQRHLDDLKTAKKRKLRWNLDEALAAIALWEMCPHLRGEKAAARESLILDPWQRFVVGSIYGWQRWDKKRQRWLRRFRVAWVEVARKNGKTTFLYPAGIYGLTLDGEEGAEVYAVATKREQARIVYGLARRAIARTPDLAEMLQVYAHTVTNDETFSKFEAQSSDASTLDGLNPSTVLADEIHKWQGRELWDVIETGMGARSQPLIWAVTTAGDEGEQDVYGQEHNYTEQVLRGVIQDDTRFGYIACLDPGDDFTDERVWRKANPGLGSSQNEDELRRMAKKAVASPASANKIKRLNFGIRTQATEAWLQLTDWDKAADPRVSWAALTGLHCYGGLDLASSNDFAALSLCLPLDAIEGTIVQAADLDNPEFWGYLFRLWMPREGRTHAETKLREIAQPWIDAGWVTATDGAVIDHEQIVSEVIQVARDFNLAGLAYDPFNAEMAAQMLAKEGIDVAKFVQQMGPFAEPTRTFEADLIAGRMLHDGNRAVRWMADNVIVVRNAAGHAMPSRKKSKNKIDGIVAAVMSRGRAMAGGGERESYYDKNPVETL